MAETFFTVQRNPRARRGIRRRADGTVQPLTEALPDGDTVGCQLDGTGAIRFLGVDTPETAFELGRTLPFFIWPNVSPFREVATITDAVPAPRTANVVAEAGDLKRARDFAKASRAAGRGLFDPADPLRFEAFEIRYLGRGERPNRGVIDLSRNDDVILRPQS